MRWNGGELVNGWIGVLVDKWLIGGWIGELVDTLLDE